MLEFQKIQFCRLSVLYQGFKRHFSVKMLFIACIIICSEIAFSYLQNDLKMTYEEFRTKYNKPTLQPDEYLMRQLIFYQNIQKLRSLISNDDCSYCGVTKFYDEASDQFQNRMGLSAKSSSFIEHEKKVTAINQGLLIKASNSSWAQNIIKVGAPLPTSLNWVDQKKVTSIKSQGSCGTCWSFATVAGIQSSMLIKGNFFSNFLYQPDLSQEFLLTCSQNGNCGGGYIEESIDLAFKSGVPYEYDLPYVGYKESKSVCAKTSKNIFYSKGTVARYSYYNINDSKIIELLVEGPLILSVSAQGWDSYSRGIMKCRQFSPVNHAVLLVGFDQNRWIIKNQWGSDWGQNGYISITRNTTQNCQVGSAVHKLCEFTLSFYLLLLISFFLAL